MSDARDGLQQAHARITEYMTGTGSARLPVNLAYVREPRSRAGTVVVGVPGVWPGLVTQYRQLFGLRDDEAQFVCSAPAVRHAKKTEFNRPLTGGLYITNPAGAGRSALGTICIVATRAGQDGFVTAGHVADHAGTVFYQPRQSNVNNWTAGTTVQVSAYGARAASDSAFLADNTGGNLAPRAIWKSNNSNYTVTRAAPDPALGTTVYMQGAALVAERSGQVAGTDVSVTFEDSGVLEHQVLASYDSREGDSGAPVYLKGPDPNVELIGLNVGTTEAGFAQPPPDPAYPPAGHGYAVISLWRHIVTDLGLAPL